MMELDADGQGQDNSSYLFVRFLGQAHKYNLRGQYFYPNKRKAEIPTANLLDIPPVEWTAFVDYYMDSKTKK
ncbi:hypothetical protein Ahy_B01g052944 [Arachis hypogaea]|uniref:Uncharacterized protein n=1 Tax=Arachis hypogaea TaxID=3818 RepID=A0A445AQU0_ARAHY|nr:hypothetical protein Ahy_B01g052944 [Arachis hypogaea]